MKLTETIPVARHIATVTLTDVPPSLNAVGSRGHWRRWHSLKKAWQNDLGLLLLAEVGLPRGWARARATAQLRFPDRRRRDSDNFSALLAKSLGDALVTGGFIPDDTAERYSFEPVTFDPDRGPRRTVVTITLEASP